MQELYLGIDIGAKEVSRSTDFLEWELPPKDTLKFNVDEAHSKSNGFSACGGLLRDSQSDFIQGFYCNLGRNNSQGAEMWSLVHVMRITRHLHLDCAIFETNYTLVAAAALNRSTIISCLKLLIEEVRDPPQFHHCTWIKGLLSRAAINIARVL
ncbi:hypothetical protein L195_g004461 [Trifolium pratense]|uniref:RNase H type-1 domain-containing protein n=1 Tax=Trifolium pratense TaxID=57577 RepID=A0A2K3NY31_TRIPR|nr:hypothetical protein L195_g004461 [Trifolium pratense]